MVAALLQIIGNDSVELCVSTRFTTIRRVVLTNLYPTAPLDKQALFT